MESHNKNGCPTQGQPFCAIALNIHRRDMGATWEGNSGLMMDLGFGSGMQGWWMDQTNR